MKEKVEEEAMECRKWKEKKKPWEKNKGNNNWYDFYRIVLFGVWKSWENVWEVFFLLFDGLSVMWLAVECWILPEPLNFLNS